MYSFLRSHKLGVAMVSAAGAAAVAAATGPSLLQSHAATDVHAARSADAVYSDYDVIDAIVFNQGRIIGDHPALQYKLLNPTARPIDAAVRHKFESAVLQRNPDFHDAVTAPLESGDPYAVKSALRVLSQRVAGVAQAGSGDVNSSPSNGPGQAAIARAAGWAWHDSVAVTEGYVVAEWAAAGVHTVAAGVTVAVALYVAPEVATYEFKVDSVDDLTENGVVATLATTLA